MLLTTSWLMAAEEDDVSTEAEKQPEEASVTDVRMIREQGNVIGYQPLTVAGQEIDATFLEETIGKDHGVIVFFHDRGRGYENYGITPLRKAFPEYGWSTLSIALDYPYQPNIYLYDASQVAKEAANAAKEAKAAKKEDPNKEPAWDDEIPEEEEEEIEPEEKEEQAEVKKLPPISNIQRIEAVMTFLKSKEAERIVFVGHGAGGDTAVTLLGELKTPVEALVLVGTAQLTSDDVWETFKFPILDIYGSNDLDGVDTAVKQRRKLMNRAGNPYYGVREVTGADHVFYGLQPQLILTIRSWLHKQFVETVEQVDE